MNKFKQADTNDQKVKDNSEIDWFDFETRMRLIIRDMLEPIIKRQDSSAHEITSVQKYFEEIDSRISSIEFLLNRSDSKTTKWDELQDQITILETNLSISQNESQLQFSQLHSSIGLWNQKFINLSDSVKDLSAQGHNLKKEILNTGNNITTVHKDVLLKFNDRFDELNKKFQGIESKITHIKLESEKSQKRVVENSSNVNMCKNLIKEITETSDTLRTDVNSLIVKKVNNESYDKVILEFNQRFRQIEFSIKTNLNTLIATDEQMDKYLPFRIQQMISETLHQIVESKVRKRLLEFEEEKYRVLKQDGPLSEQASHDFDFNYKIKHTAELKDEKDVEREEKLIAEQAKKKVAQQTHARMGFIAEWNNLRKKNEEWTRKIANEARNKELGDKFAIAFKATLPLSPQDITDAPHNQDDLNNTNPTMQNLTAPSVKNINHASNASNLVKSTPLSNISPTVQINDPESEDDSRDVQEAQHIHQDLNAELEPFRREIKSIATKCENKIARQNDTIEAFFQTFNDQIMGLQQTFEERQDKILQECQDCRKDVESVSASHERMIVKMSKVNQVLTLFNECIKIQQILDVSDEIDREKMGLQGVKESLKGDGGYSDPKINSMPNFTSVNLQNINNSAIMNQTMGQGQESMHTIPLNNNINHINMSLPHHKNYSSFVKRNRQLNEKTPSKDKLNMSLGPIKFKRFSQSQTKINERDADLNIELNNKCMSCSGSNGILLQAFKLACINQTSSKVIQSDRSQDKKDLLQQRDNILSKVKEEMNIKGDK